MLQGIYFISVESMPGKYRKVFVFNFNYSVWMNTFCHRVSRMLYIFAVEQTMCETHDIVITYNTCHVISHMSSENEAALGLPQLGVRFLLTATAAK